MKTLTKIIIAIIFLILLVWFGFWLYENGRMISYNEPPEEEGLACLFDTEAMTCTPEDRCQIVEFNGTSYCMSK